MADLIQVRKSKYALKREGKLKTHGVTRQRRICDFCKRTLSGRRGHGFPVMNGRRLACGTCKRP